MTTLDDYQQEAIKLAVYPGKISIDGLCYTVLGLCGEAGELANKLKKVLRDDGGQLTNETNHQLAKELGGVLWYVAAVAKELGYDLSFIADLNMNELLGRKQRGTLQGSGDDR